MNNELIESELTFETNNFEIRLIVFILHTTPFLFFEKLSSLSFFSDFFYLLL